MKRMVVLLALVAACKKDEPAPAPAPEPTQAPQAQAPADAPVPAGAAAMKIAPEVDEAAVARGKAAVGTLKGALVGKLQAALGEGGPVKAIDVCSVEAAKVTVEGAEVGRMTRRPRNPKNAVAGWQVEALEHFESLVAAGAALPGAAFARKLDDGRIAYAEPLVIQEMCTQCHGETIAPEVTQVLAARYPEDRATGYQVGELRGLAWAVLAP